MCDIFQIVDNDSFNEVNAPSVLFKYRSWHKEFERKVLTEKELYLSSPGKFDDTMDCNLEEQFPEGKDLYDLFVEDCKIKYPSKNRDERRKYAKYWSKHSPLANKELRDKLLDEFKNMRDESFGVLSLTLRNDNDYLWERYGDQHKGFCVGVNTQKLIQYS